MPRRRRTDDELEGDCEAQRAAATLGAELRRSRRQRRLTQQELAERIGVSRPRLSGLERGLGASAGLGLWFRAGAALGRPFGVSFSRDQIDALSDAGHLAAQEIVLRHARAHGRIGRFELQTRWSATSGSVDVGVRDDRCRVLILTEIWNRLADLGSSARTTQRKVAQAEGLAEFRGYKVAVCWLLVDTFANRTIVRRYPEVFRSTFRGSSAAWVRALVDGACPPAQPGVAWIDIRSHRISEVRLRG